MSLAWLRWLAAGAGVGEESSTREQQWKLTMAALVLDPNTCLAATARSLACHFPPHEQRLVQVILHPMNTAHLASQREQNLMAAFIGSARVESSLRAALAWPHMCAGLSGNAPAQAVPVGYRGGELCDICF